MKQNVKNFYKGLSFDQTLVKNLFSFVLDLIKFLKIIEN